MLRLLVPILTTVAGLGLPVIAGEAGLLVPFRIISTSNVQSASQFARPSSDIDNTGGYSPTPLWQQMDEVTADDDTTAVNSGPNPNESDGTGFEVTLSSVIDPNSNSGHIIRRMSGRIIALVGVLALAGAIIMLRPGLGGENTAIAAVDIKATPIPTPTATPTHSPHQRGPASSER